MCTLKALLVSRELIRVAILWHELWHDALEEASRLYFTENNPEGMIMVLEPLHEMIAAVRLVCRRSMQHTSLKLGPNNNPRNIVCASIW